jgi:transglutaminase-like putative cysteine protease
LALFGGVTPGWQRVQAICDFAHDRICFGYEHARCDRTASEGHEERVGVCRDFAHLAVTLCRCMNIPARYCTGYLGDIGVPVDPAPMDFSAWFEAYLDGRWFTFDARHNHPRIGRIEMARGRDAADVAISTSFGAAQLASFAVTTVEISESALPFWLRQQRRPDTSGVAIGSMNNNRPLRRSIFRNNFLRRLLHVLQPRRNNNGYGNERNRFPYRQ